MSKTITEPTSRHSAAHRGSVSDDSAAGRGGKFLTFFLRGEEYGLEILKVQEIIGMMGVTPVPRTPEFVCGVINLRGKVIPIVDLRLKFGMERAEQTEETCIIVVQANGVQIGIVVDKVSEVLNIAGKDIEDAPSFGTEVNTDYILGIGKSESRIKLLLDIDRVLIREDFAAICSTGSESDAKNAAGALEAAETEALAGSC
jgi:purine-binding chemotaxis protein CheW